MKATGHQDGDSVSQPAGGNQADIPHDASVAPFLAVGIGASAGGLEALQEFFGNVPTNSGMAFIVVTHQHPTHPSMLAELLDRVAVIPILQAEAGLQIRPNHAYIGMQGSNLAIANGALQHVDIPAGTSPNLPIDFFFRSLAEDQKHNAVGIILSGTGSDGSLGIQAIKAASGLLLAQETGSAKFPAMPASAIATGLVDFQLAPAAMVAKLLAYARSGHDCSIPAQLNDPAFPENGINKIMLLIRNRTGHDFFNYKSTTLVRRIERRMSMHQIGTVEEYVRLLAEHKEEVDLLFADLLIGVTHFFRNQKAWEALSLILVDLIRGQPEQEALRIWVAGCATGEEAYSVGILVQECMQQVSTRRTVQIFATDIDGNALSRARAGVYPEGISADVTPSRLQAYFSRDDASYVIRRDIREMVVFADHNLIRDPPFTRIDLILCRNLLIYMNGAQQQKLLPVFHYALRNNGVLFLGTSETTGQNSDYFTPIDRHWKIYRRKPGRPHFLAEMPSSPSTAAPTSPRARMPDRMSALVEKALLSMYVPASIVVNALGEILYIHGRTGAYLQPASGPSRHQIADMAREGLRLELMIALRKVASDGIAVSRAGLQVQGDHGVTHVDMSVSRLEQENALNGLLLITLRPSVQKETKARNTQRTADVQLTDLEQELDYLRESQRLTQEELEAANEDLRASNEELQSSNEENQAANEELETSKEELQSLNEELTTVNAELLSKLDEFSHVNDDMQNLLDSTDIATLFLDNNLNIKRYTSEIQKLFMLRIGDLGRPFTELASKLLYSNLPGDCRDVLDTLEMKETEVSTSDGATFLMRIMPYRTASNVVDGLVLIFIDISQMKKVRKNLFAMFQLFRDAKNPLLVVNQHNQITELNEAAMLEWNVAADDVLDRSLLDFVSKAQREAMAADLDRCRSGQPILRRKYQLVGHQGEDITAILGMTLVTDERQGTELIAITLQHPDAHEE